MKKDNGQSLKEAINELINTYHLKENLNKTKLTGSWDKIVGKMIAKHTLSLYIKKDTLHVKLDSSVLREELSYAKQEIIDKVNEEIGEDYIKKVIFE